MNFSSAGSEIYTQSLIRSSAANYMLHLVKTRSWLGRPSNPLPAELYLSSNLFIDSLSSTELCLIEAAYNLLIPPVGSPVKANSFWANSLAALSYSFLLTILSISDKVVS